MAVGPVRWRCGAGPRTDRSDSAACFHPPRTGRVISSEAPTLHPSPLAGALPSSGRRGRSARMALPTTKRRTRRQSLAIASSGHSGHNGCFRKSLPSPLPLFLSPSDPLRSPTAQRSIVGNVDLLFPQGGAYLTVQKHECPAMSRAFGLGQRSGRKAEDQCARGSGRTWNLTTLGRVPLPVSMWNGVRFPLVVHRPRPFQPAFGSSMRPSIHLA